MPSSSSRTETTTKRQGCGPSFRTSISSPLRYHRANVGGTVERRAAAAAGGRMVDNDGDPLAPHSHSPAELKELLAAERKGAPFLGLRDREGRLVLFAPGRGGRTRTVGRRPEMDLPIAWDPEVSGVHAELQGLGGEWTVVDDGLSTNGTYVNGQRVSGRQRLRDGDRIRRS